MRRRAAGLVTSALGLMLAGSASAQDEWLGADKALHFGASVALSSAGYAVASAFTGDRPTRGFVGTLLCVGAGFGKEAVDLLGPGDASLKDLAWDGVGCTVGLLLALGIDWLLAGERRQAAPRPAALLLPAPRWLQRVFLDRALVALDHRRLGGVGPTGVFAGE